MFIFECVWVMMKSLKYKLGWRGGGVILFSVCFDLFFPMCSIWILFFKVMSPISASSLEVITECFLL